MRPYVKLFDCGHHGTVKSWRRANDSKCPGCKTYEEWYASSGLRDVDTPEKSYGKQILERLFDGCKAGSHRTPEVVAKEIMSGDKETLALWQLSKQNDAPPWVRAVLEGTVLKKKESTNALAAKAAKVALLKAMPTLEVVSAKSSSYSGGDSINIVLGRFTSDKDFEKAKAIVDTFQYGHFDGMTDMYEYSKVREDIPQVKYAFVDRASSY